MPDPHYANSKLAALYDLDSPWSIDRDFYLSLADRPNLRILDLGCGTGLLCDAFAANNHEVTGVDSSPAMLEVARRKPHDKAIEWVESFVQTFQSAKLFDLIIMTGHAFQVLLEDADVLATFSVMRKHLNTGGVIAFESRNPAIDWAGQWEYDMHFEIPGGYVQESRRFLALENDRMTFELSYQFANERLVSPSELRFWSRAEIEQHLAASGLRVERLLGDWDGTPFDEKYSLDMIFLVRASE